MSSKRLAYEELVATRKTCDACGGLGLKNPSQCAGGAFDSSEIGPWTRWQGNLHAKVMVVAQDWGDVATFQKQDGIDWDNSQTNKVLRDFLAAIGFRIALPSKSKGRGSIFLTNAVLCLKTGKGGAQAPVKEEWFRNCGPRFLKPQVDIVKPRLVICLGQRSYETLLRAYDLKPVVFRKAVNSHQPVTLPNGASVFPVYHCGPRIRNTHRKMEQQKCDWKFIAQWVRSNIGIG